MQIPEKMLISIAEDHETAMLAIGIGTRLLLADERVYVLSLSFYDAKRKLLFILKNIVRKAALQSSKSLT